MSPDNPIVYWVCDADGLRRETGQVSAMVDRRRSLDDSGFIWWELDDPDLTATNLVAQVEAFNPVALRDITTAHTRPKLDVYRGQAVVVVKTVWYIAETESVETGDITMFLAPQLLVTVRHGSRNPLQDVRQRLESVEPLRRAGPRGAAYTITDQVVNDYLGGTTELEAAVNQIEREVFSGKRVDRIERIYTLKREVAEFRDAVQPLQDVVDNMRERQLPGSEVRESHFQALDHHVVRAASEVSNCESLLSSILDAHLGQISMWQNQDMRRISAWAAVFAMPTIISGIYGMNFRRMPELHWLLGYPLALLLMVVLCTLLYFGFRRNGWL